MRAIVKNSPERAVITLATFTLTSIAICIFMAIHQNLQSRRPARLHETCGRALVVTDLLIGRAGCELQYSPDIGHWPPNGVLANTPGRYPGVELLSQSIAPSQGLPNS